MQTEPDAIVAAHKKIGGNTGKPVFRMNGKIVTAEELIGQYPIKNILQKYRPYWSASAAAGAGAGFVPPATPGPEAPQPTVEPSSRPTPTPRMAMGFDIDKHNQTREQVDRYEAAGFNFHESEDYLKQKDQFEPELDFRRHDAALNQAEFDKVRGIKTASAAKQGAEQAGVGVNFESPEIQQVLGVNDQQDAVYYQGRDKEMAVDAIVAQYRTQLEQEGIAEPEREQKVKELGDGLRNAETLRVHNNASLSSRLDQARHEKAHAQTRNLSDQQVEQIFATVSPQQRQAMMADIDKRYAGMSEIQKKKEVLAEMVGVGKGSYEVGDKTAQAFKAAGIKTRGEQVATTVSAGGAAIKAAGVSVGQQTKRLVDSIKAVASEVGSVSAQVRQQTLGEIQNLYNGIKGKIKNVREQKALGELMGSFRDYTQTRNQRETVETETKQQLGQRQQQKAENLEKYQKAMEQRDQAIQQGKSGDAFEQSAIANRYVDENKQLDTEMKALQGKIGQAKAAEAAAMTGVVKAKERFEQVSGSAKPKPKSEVNQAVSTIAHPVNERQRQQARQVIEQAPTEEVAAAAQGAIKEEGEKLKRAEASTNTEAIVAALTSIEHILQEVKSSLEKLPKDKVGVAERSRLDDIIRQISSSRGSAAGGQLDPGSTSGLLRDVNVNLTKIYRQTGQKTGQVPTETSPKTPV